MQAKRPVIKLASSSENNNIYHILALCGRELQKQHRITDYNIMRDRVFDSGSYQEALTIIREYVNLIDDEIKFTADMLNCQVCVRLIFGDWKNDNESGTHYTVTKDGKLSTSSCNADTFMSYELAKRWESQYKYILKDIIESIYISY